MCFGSKDKQLQDDEAPRPAPGRFHEQPTYANTDPAPKASMPPTQQPYYQPPQQSPPPFSPYTAPPPAGPPAAELSAVSQSNPPAELASNDYAPPAGPPPGRGGTGAGGDDFAPPPGPPPGRAGAGSGSDDVFAPPPGPPPSHSKTADDYTQPPPGPPPSHLTKQQHDWEAAVPDTSLFPPPPALFSGWYRSPTSNATEEEAEAGERWCAEFPLTAPLTLDEPALAALRSGDVRLMTPAVGFKGRLAWKAPGVWEGATQSSATDSCIIGYPPLYAVREHSPLLAGSGGLHTVYYEVAVKQGEMKRRSKEEVCLALGFTALPYPSFRMPGWHRGSLAVHGDDGHKFINDRWGGKSFTEPFKRGETYGIGMTFRAVGGGRIETEVFFTRQGRLSGSWNLHEETDAQEDLPVTGLEGYHDLSCAIGTYKTVAFEAVFDPAKWLYRPPR